MAIRRSSDTRVSSLGTQQWPDQVLQHEKRIWDAEADFIETPAIEARRPSTQKDSVLAQNGCSQDLSSVAE
jgi:hypothetical protein